MAEPFFEIEMDTRAVVAALDRLGDLAGPYVKEAAGVTAERIATEARARVARRTGVTLAGIGVREDASGLGYLVVADRQQFPLLPAWLEYGTKHMNARAFFGPSARLEEGPHMRRIEDAIDKALSDVHG